MTSTRSDPAAKSAFVREPNPAVDVTATTNGHGRPHARNSAAGGDRVDEIDT